MLKFFFIIIIIAFVALFLIFAIRGSEDTWLCTEEGWVKHGNPQAPMPAYDCGDKKPSKEMVNWETIKSVINNCEVKMVMQAHSLDVSVNLKDGRILTAIEPKIDDIINIAVEAQNKCGSFPIATE